MKRRSFKNSDMDRAPRKRHFFRGLVAKKPSRLRAYTHAMDDRPRSINITRAVAAIIIVHLIALGGILLHEHFSNAGTQTAANQAPPQPPLAQQVSAKEEAAKPTESLKSTQVATTTSKQTVTTVPPLTAEQISTTATTTIPSESIMDDVRVDTTAAPVATRELQAVADEEIQAYVVENGATASNSLMNDGNYYFTVTGDSWESVAAQHNITVDALKKVNPRMATIAALPAGEYLKLPVKKNAASASNTARPSAATAIYSVAPGDNLSKIAKKHGMTLDEILKLNNISKENAHRIQIGQKLRVHQR